MFSILAQLRTGISTFKRLLPLLTGICIGVAIILSGKAGSDATSSDKYCDQTCHVHPDATQTWVRSPHYTTKSGVVVHCIDCHLPSGGSEYYTEKIRLGGVDIYGKLFKDLTKVNWQSMQTLTQARTFTYDSACIRCHANLFSVGLSKKGVDGHLHYQRSKDKMRCINCHLHTGHFRGKQAEEVADEAAAQEEELEKAFPSSPEGFKNYSEVIPGLSVRIRMVAVPGGTFEMGSPESEPYRRADEGPVHKVKISPFWMERTEVTWREYEIYLLQRGNIGRNRDAASSGKADAMTGPTAPYGSPDQGWGRGSRPAITMTYHAATMYCQWLSQITGKRYRLPTESEWEYAARAGATTPYFFAGDPASFTTQRWLNHILGVKTAPLIDYAWYQGDGMDETHPAGATKPNAWGMVDMLGNVREFCLDWYDPDAYARMADERHRSAGPGLRPRSTWCAAVPIVPMPPTCAARRATTRVRRIGCSPTRNRLRAFGGIRIAPTWASAWSANPTMMSRPAQIHSQGKPESADRVRTPLPNAAKGRPATGAARI